MSGYPNTNAAADALVALLLTLTYQDGVTKVYTSYTDDNGQLVAAVQKGEFKSMADIVAQPLGCAGEVYSNADSSERHGFGGLMRDVQAFFVLSLVSLDNAQTAETLINTVRDALVSAFARQVTLGGIGNIIDARIKPESGKFIKIPRDSSLTMFRGFVVEVTITSEWFVTVGQ